jgi:predicted GIY-YIG superfamily endonuclease
VPDSPLRDEGRVRFTLGELLLGGRACSERLRPLRFSCVYVVSDGDVILYVGSTGRGVQHRMRQHLSGAIRFDRHLRSVGDAALSWTVDAYVMSSEAMARLVEKYAIGAMRPVFNDRDTEQEAA